MYSRIVQVRGSTCDWHEVALRRRHRGDPQGDGAWELQHDQGVSHNNWAWLINILQCIVTLLCFKKKTVLSHQSCRFSLRHWTSTNIGVSQSQCSVSVSGAHFSKRKSPGGWCGRTSLGEHWKGFSSVPFFIKFEEKSFVLFCPIFHRISKVQNLFRSQKLWPSSAKVWVSCPAWQEESPVGKWWWACLQKYGKWWWACLQKYTDVYKIDQSTLNIVDHFAPFAKLFWICWVFLLPCKVGDIEGEKERIIRLLDRQGTLTMEERDQPNLRRLSLATAWGEAMKDHGAWKPLGVLFYCCFITRI